MKSFKENKEIAKNIAIDTLKGGLGLLFPTLGMIYIIMLIYNFLLSILYPITNFVGKFLSLPNIVIDLFSLFLVISICFLCGFILKTKFGKFSYLIYERILKKLKIFKIFNILKEIYNQLFNNSGEKAFSEAVIAYPHGRNNAAWSGLISSKWEKDGQLYISIFFPTCPNFTSGVLMHIKRENVDILEGVPVDEMMKTVISCGSGTKELMMKYNFLD
jgi:uncharacterized membrane protein